VIVKKLPTIPVIDANFKHNAVLVAIMNEDETITCCEKKVRARAIKGSEDQAITCSGDDEDDSSSSADYVGEVDAEHVIRLLFPDSSSDSWVGLQIKLDFI